MVANYGKNTQIYGDAIRETSTAGTGTTSWYSNFSNFSGLWVPFTAKGGWCFHTSGAGLFDFERVDGCNTYYNGFRAVLVSN